jgi:uncharacterized protein YceH (UPF0502 family)
VEEAMMIEVEIDEEELACQVLEKILNGDAETFYKYIAEQINITELSEQFETEEIAEEIDLAALTKYIKSSSNAFNGWGDVEDEVEELKNRVVELELMIEKMNNILNKVKKIPLIGKFLNEQFGFKSTTA